MKLRKGQYFYGFHRGVYRIYKSSIDTENTRIECGGSPVPNEDYDTKKEAMQRVCELNGWKFNEEYFNSKQNGRINDKYGSVGR